MGFGLSGTILEITLTADSNLNLPGLFMACVISPQTSFTLGLIIVKKKCNRCSSTTYSTEVNASEEEAVDNGLQSNDQVVPIDLEECHDEPKVLHLKGCLEDTKGNDIS